MRKIPFLFFVPLVLLLSGCQSTGMFSGESVVDIKDKSLEVTEERYVKERKEKAVVLFDVNWGRKWGCAGRENARLYRFTFDRLPADKRSNDAPADITVANTSNVFVDNRFLGYVILVPPGEYALSGYTTKTGDSKKGSAFWGMYRSDFQKQKRSHGGTFKAIAGETVYIGNFFLDCATEPMIWRYYTEEKNMAHQIKGYQDKYPFLDLGNVTYRLFDTELFGRKPK